MAPVVLLDEVVDRDSFIAFVRELIAEREEAERIEREEPDRHRWGGALGWQNGDISAFLEAGLRGYFTPGEGHRPAAVPTWRMFAEFLYFGKIYE